MHTRRSSTKEIHLKENGEKASKWKTSSEASQQSFSPLQRCCSVTHWPPVAHSNSGDQNRLLWSKADGEKNCLDWPSLRQPWQFCSSLPSAQSGRLSHLSGVNTWTQSSTPKRIQTFVFLIQLCAVCRPPPFLDTLSISAVVLEVGALQNVGEWFEVPKKHRRKFDYISYNHI